MIWIELLGPSGVGKSYIYKEMLSRNKYIQPELNLSYKGLFFKMFSPSHKMGSSLRYKEFRLEFSKFVPIYEKRDTETIHAFLQGLDLYTDEPIVKLNLSNYFHYKFKEFKFLQARMDNNSLFFSEDGILHLNYGVSDMNIHKILKPDFIINLTATAEYIQDNRLKRIKEKRHNLIEKIHSESILISEVFPKNYVNYNGKVDVLRQVYKDRMLDVDVESQSIEAIVGQIENQLKKWINWG